MKRSKRMIAFSLIVTLFFASALPISKTPLLVSAEEVSSSDIVNTTLTSTEPTLVTNLNDYDSNEVIVTYKSDIPSSSVANDIAKNEDTKDLTDQSMLIELDNKSELNSTIKELSSDKNVLSIQPNYTYHIQSTPTDTYYSKEWGLNNNGTFTDDEDTSSVADIDMNVPEAWDVFNGGRDITVAVIDTGVDYTHSDLKNVMWTNTGEISGDGIDNDKNGYIDDIHGWNFYSGNNTLFHARSAEDDHGTHIAGIIAAERNNIGVAGVASNTNVRIMSVKALGGQDGSGSTSSIIEAIQYAEENGAKICNLSFGIEVDDKALSNVIKDSDMLFVCAAGNGDENSNAVDIDESPMYPASYSYDNIVSVANLTCNGTLHYSSNYGVNSVDVAAPGTTIASTVVGNEYSYMTGTSMAAPMVTAVLAMVYAYYDDITVLETKNIVLSTTRSLPSLTGKVATGGLVDAYAALSLNSASIQALDQTAPTIITKTSTLTGSYKKILKVTITDSSGNLSKVRYAKGIQPASYFDQGANGTELTLTNHFAIMNVSKTTTYTIYAIDTVGNETVKTIKITVTPPTNVAFQVSTKKLKLKSTYMLKASLSPSTTHSKYTYSSSNSSIVRVNKTTGKIRAKKVGTAVITITTENGLTSKCKVTVTK
ncbi:S8 family serine peptidase [Anaeromicropila herbilytica]|uniref:BIG2 domain-containing protein n=1 Tax=Anaeromicropila herbilytica TaxID=2785025 RepID=A0A7R7EHM8_9FIRM|nr:S8 family serine peptidase [Anaeromicropila herbilytica]BCN28874.1 hypothetical protein bsdtb5_01690 [Anaeromicropila herbilytica]